MTRRKRLSSLASSLSFKLFLILLILIVCLFAAYTVIYSTLQDGILEQQARAEAARHGDLIIQGLYTSMLLNERERTHAEIALIGAEPGIKAIRIYNKNGTIMFSSEEGEIGKSVDMEAEACYICHASAQPLEAVSTQERSRVYRGSDGERILGLITPIQNEESCWSAACHAHSSTRSVLGVLDVQMSMEAADLASARARRITLVLAVGVIIFSMLVVAVIVYRAIYVPARKLLRGTEALARGDLDARIDLDRSDELGRLAESFNQMARNLKVADEEVRAWSRTLEDRVAEKTDELERMHAQVRQVEKAASLGRMAASVAHELNNPLSGILTSAKLAEKRVARTVDDGDTKEGILRNLELIRSESTRCGKIVSDLLTYARQNTTDLGRHSLNQLVGHHIKLGEVETSTELELDDDTITCDGDQIVQALIALCINAVEAMPEGGRLVLRTGESETEGWVCLLVSDTGVGISPDVNERIFDPFFSTKSETKGVGLGLAVVYGIVQRHGGSIAVDSTLGEGTTFIMELPRHPASEGVGLEEHTQHTYSDQNE
jgi:two-component system NtrC family sensor kinase